MSVSVRKIRREFFLPLFLSVFVVICIAQLSAGMPEDIVLTPVAAYPHDEKAFTQGLFFDGGFLYESTGQYAQSTLRKVDPKTGQVLLHINIPNRYFAEGLALASGKIFQLTWRENMCFVFDKATLQKKDDFRYSGEGWGLTFDGEHLIMSDGSAVLKFLDPKTFKRKRKIDVLDKTVNTKKEIPVLNLNELEYIHGEIWANVWQTTKIVRIDPHRGKVIGWIEMAAFVPEQHKADTQNCVLNGIAFDAATDTVYITGKNWNIMHVLKLTTDKR
ncbi:MAG: glutaminyl-peptide cyclotransferase [Planctomycetaceae bacterium]|jgi:glutaminyl-peptide cyclotransferase|nr:glutaminyl-peptide cyclotransferase [Planctomycetaceae bacterium]